METIAADRANREGHQTRAEEHEPHDERRELLRIGFVAVAVLATWFQVWRPVPRFDLVALFATAVGGYPVFKEALSNLFARRMTMELSMTIAVIAALTIGEAFTALVILLFVLVAEVLERMTVDRGRRAIKDLLDFLPGTVSVQRSGGTKEVDVNLIGPGDVVLVRPGGRIPVDGMVVAGDSFVDQSTITGESQPVEKIVGASVFAGTFNQSGALEIRTSRVGRDTAFARILEAVEQAEKSRAPIQRTADRLAGYLVYFAIGAAALTFFITHNPRSTISVIIVAGACGIAAGTPLAILGAIGRAARHGAIIRGGLYLEALGRVDTVVLDKTGTLTFGAPEVVGIHPADGVTDVEVVAAAASAEAPSEHPLGKAVLNKARAMSIAPSRATSFNYTPGRGIVCFCEDVAIIVGSRAHLQEWGIAVPQSVPAGSNILVAKAGRFLGWLEVADVMRPEASLAVDRLQAMGFRLVLLTGDTRSIAMSVASRLGISEVQADLLPDQKLAYVQQLQRSGKKVAMIGDGINDAPALAQAEVGIAMGSGTDATRECADIVLLGNDLVKFVETVDVARWCRSVIYQNFMGTLAVDGVGVLLGAFGLLNPLLAAFIHVSSELVFLLNSSRLLSRAKRGRR
jgi:Cd2+/Zn2+-exporting ATPase/Cu+-exporting ATPase